MSARKRISRSVRVLAALALLLAVAPAGHAHHPGAVDRSLKSEAPASGFHVEVTERYTAAGTLQDGGDHVPNPADEFLDTSITQVGLAYDATPRVGVRLDLPIVVHEFRRLTEGGSERGEDAGLGDLSLLAVLRPVWFAKPTCALRLSLLGGLKLPSGNPDRLGEEEEHEAAGGTTTGAHRNIVTAAHGVEASGVHGHDLALGSGSVDGIIGGSAYGSWRWLFASASLEYAIRTEGDFDYRYANELVWSGGPGVRLLRTARYSLGVQAWLTGLTKGKDEQGGRAVDDTSFTGLYMGPRAIFTWGEALVADLDGELPLLQNTTGVQVVPDYVIRAGIGWRF